MTHPNRNVYTGHFFIPIPNRVKMKSQDKLRIPRKKKCRMASNRTLQSSSSREVSTRVQRTVEAKVHPARSRLASPNQKLSREREGACSQPETTLAAKLSSQLTAARWKRRKKRTALASGWVKNRTADSTTRKQRLPIISRSEVYDCQYSYLDYEK